MAGSTRSPEWDAVIVGAGPAGAAAAYDLAAGGARVLLLDKAQFPRAKACAGGLTRKAVRALRFPVTPVVRKTVSSMDLEHPSAPGGSLTVSRGAPVCSMTVRSELDAFALEQARRRGAEFRRVGALAGLTEHPDRVVLSVAGQPDPIQTRFLLGADGVHSTVRTLLTGGQAPWFRRGFALEANVPYSATGGREFPLVFDFSPVPGGYGWLFPRNDHVNVGLGTMLPADSRSAPALNGEALTRYIAARCGTAEHDRPVGQFLGMGAANYRPAAWSQRVLLAGDAAGTVDALTGEGIWGAIVSGQAAAAAMLRAWRSGAEASAALLYGKRLQRLASDLRVGDSAADKFYSRPERGFHLMESRLVQRAVLHCYADGVSLGLLARALKPLRALGSRAARPGAPA